MIYETLAAQLRELHFMSKYILADVPYHMGNLAFLFNIYSKNIFHIFHSPTN